MLRWDPKVYAASGRVFIEQNMQGIVGHNTSLLSANDAVEVTIWVAALFRTMHEQLQHACVCCVHLTAF